MSRQDRQGVRQPADLERKYNFGKMFREQGNKSTRQEEQIANLSKDLAEFMDSTRIALAELGKAIEEVKQSSSGMSALQQKVDDLSELCLQNEANIDRLMTAVTSLLERVSALDGIVEEL